MDGRVLEWFKDMRFWYMCKFVFDKDIVGYFFIRLECDVKMYVVLGFSNLFLDCRFVFMYVVLGGSVMDKFV